MPRAAAQRTGAGAARSAAPSTVPYDPDTWARATQSLSATSKGGLGQDSIQFTNVKELVRSLNTSMGIAYGQGDMAQIASLQARYGELITYCQQYLGKHGSSWTANGKQRRQEIGQILENARIEQGLLNQVPEIMQQQGGSASLRVWMNMVAHRVNTLAAPQAGAPRPSANVALPGMGVENERARDIGAQPSRILAHERDEAYENF